VLVKGIHNSLGSAAWVSRTFVDEEVAVLVVLLIELLHVVLPMSSLHSLMMGTILGGTVMSGSVIGMRRAPCMQISVSCWQLPVTSKGEENERLTTSLIP